VWSETAGDPSSPLVVVVHGSMDRSAGLLRLSRRLDGEHRVLRYDRRGYGRSRGARFVEIAGAGHLGPNTHSAAVADLLGRFVRTIPAGSRPAP
jgi:pimeloyl-ACP methyl ester carboxylesterase